MKTLAALALACACLTLQAQSMSTGATDGSRLRNAGIPTYGTSGIFVEYGEIRIHGRDERVLNKSFFDGSEFLYRLVKTLSE